MEVITPEKTRTLKTLRVGFVVEQYPKQDYLKRAAHKAWDMFLKDMAKQDWEYAGREVRLQGPRPHVPLKTLPKVSAQMKMHPFEVVSEVPTLEEASHWIFFLESEFWRDLPRAEFLITAPGEVPIDYPVSITRHLNVPPGGK